MKRTGIKKVDSQESAPRLICDKCRKPGAIRTPCLTAEEIRICPHCGHDHGQSATPEIWECNMGPKGYCAIVSVAEGGAMVAEFRSGTEEEQKSRAERCVATHNALAGIPNPAAVGKVVEAARAYMAYNDPAGEVDATEWDTPELHPYNALRAALAELDKEAGT